MGSETLQTPDDRLLPIEVAEVGEFHRLVVRDPEPEQRTEDFSIEGAGEGERHECPREGEWVWARLSHGDEPDAFLYFVVVGYSVTFCMGIQGKWGDEDCDKQTDFTLTRR